MNLVVVFFGSYRYW